MADAKTVRPDISSEALQRLRTDYLSAKSEGTKLPYIPYHYVFALKPEWIDPADKDGKGALTQTFLSALEKLEGKAHGQALLADILTRTPLIKPVSVYTNKALPNLRVGTDTAAQFILSRQVPESPLLLFDAERAGKPHQNWGYEELEMVFMHEGRHIADMVFAAVMFQSGRPPRMLAEACLESRGISSEQQVRDDPEHQAKGYSRLNYFDFTTYANDFFKDLKPDVLKKLAENGMPASGQEYFMHTFTRMALFNEVGCTPAALEVLHATENALPLPQLTPEKRQAEQSEYEALITKAQKQAQEWIDTLTERSKSEARERGVVSPIGKQGRAPITSGIQVAEANPNVDPSSGLPDLPRLASNHTARAALA